MVSLAEYRFRYQRHGLTRMSGFGVRFKVSQDRAESSWTMDQEPMDLGEAVSATNELGTVFSFVYFTNSIGETGVEGLRHMKNGI